MSKTIVKGMLTDTKVHGIKINTSLPCKPGYYSNYSERLVSYVVIHYSGNPKDSAKANATYFHNGPKADASAHLFTDDTSIYQSVELRDAAWAVGSKSGYKHPHCRNANSISVEMCTSGGGKVSKKTQINAAYMCASLLKRINVDASGVDKYLLRHYDVTGKDCPHQFVSHPEEWKRFKKWVKNILKTGKHEAETITVSESLAEVKAPVIAKPTLKEGDSGNEVKTLQKNLQSALKDNWVLAEMRVDGKFTSTTAKAVKSFQKKHKLDVTGIYDTKTANKMESILK